MDPLDNQRRVDYNPYNLLERLVIYEERSDAIPMLPMLPMLLPLIHLNNITTFLGGIDDESYLYIRRPADRQDAAAGIGPS